MSSFRTRANVCLKTVWLALLALAISSCSQQASLNETAYVVPERLKLKNSTAQAARVIGEVKTGERVTILSRLNAEDGTPWVKISAPGVEDGWAEARYFVKESIVEQTRQIAEQIKGIPAQAIGKSKATLKLRLTPDRTTEDNVATLLPSGTNLEIVARERKPRPALPDAKAGGAKDAKEGDENPAVKFDEWFQVRLKDYAVLPAGWIYGGSIEMEIPAEIVYFVSTGRKIVGWQKLGTVHGDDSRTGDHYLVAERKVFDADESADFDRVKVLAYDPATRNYTTPFREDLLGKFPILLQMDGQRGTFQLTALEGKDKQSYKKDYTVEMPERGKVKVTKQGDPATKKK